MSPIPEALLDGGPAARGVLRRGDRRAAALLDDGVLAVVAALHRRFEPRRTALLAQRHDTRRLIQQGRVAELLRADDDVRDGDWRIAPRPGGARRVVELSGPATPAMARAVVASDVDLFMADLEDQLPPGWGRVLAAHAAILDACRAADGPTVVVRPRAWHADEPAVEVDGAPVSATLFDVAVHLAHRAHDDGAVPHLYLPKVETRAEAALWRELLNEAERLVDLPAGVTDVSLLVETVGAAVAAEGMLYELRERVTAVNAGRWDFLFSYALLFAEDAERCLPEPAALTVEHPLVAAYTRRIVDVARRRGLRAIGGMTPCWPAGAAPTAAECEHVRRAKALEAGMGFDGSTIAHPELAAAARAGLAGGAAAAERRPPTPPLGFLDARPGGFAVTDGGLTSRVGLLVSFLERWCAGEAPIVIGGDAQEVATAELARIQLWTWIRHGVARADGGVVDRRAVARAIDAVAVGSAHGRAGQARELARRLVLTDEPTEYLTDLLADDRRPGGRGR
ncbi:hypothetical protein [Patulibacter defluvii]|uniref:hypothetical protein n=1 Tax=Patulibacter defluvii TaxID=3095358 RepID=UPI002A74AB48|nr:hypothetical protein [Patulibacter sp. DM4]